MSASLVVAVWVLASLDCALMGYRVAMGRNGRLDKRGYHLRRSGSAALLGQVPIALVVALAAWLAHAGGAGTTASFDTAMRRFVVVGGSYAVLILGTWALTAVPSVTIRTAANVVVFGPFTLLRPLIVVLTVVVAIWGNATPALVLVALLVAVPGVLVEPIADHLVAARLLDPPAAR